MSRLWLEDEQKELVIRFMHDHPGEVFDHRQLAAQLGLQHQAVDAFFNGVTSTLLRVKHRIALRWAERLAGLQWRGKGKFGWFPGEPTVGTPSQMTKVNRRSQPSAKTNSVNKPSTGLANGSHLVVKQQVGFGRYLVTNSHGRRAMILYHELPEGF